MLMTVELAQKYKACWADSRLRKTLGNGKTLKELRIIVSDSYYYTWCQAVITRELYEIATNKNIVAKEYTYYKNMYYSLCGVFNIEYDFLDPVDVYDENLNKIEEKLNAY